MRARRLAPVALIVALAAPAFADDPETDGPGYDPVTAFVVYPLTGAREVPSNTMVDVASADAVELVGPQGEPIPVQRLTWGPTTMFAPVEELVAGLHTVLAVPVPDADNYVGPDVFVEIGTFTTIGARDEEAPTVTPVSARWILGELDMLVVEIQTSGLRGLEPAYFSLDLGDAGTAPDGAPDHSGIGSGLSGTLAPQFARGALSFEAETATVRTRAIDAAGNIGPWSESVPFVVEVEEPPALSEPPAPSASGCAATPRGVAAQDARGAWALVLVSIVLGRGVRRR